jgi:ATP synthase protein I
MGAELTAALVGFTLLGFWIDRHFGTRPWGLLVCVLCGLVGGLYNTLRTSAQALSSSASYRERGPGSGSAKDPGGRKLNPRTRNRSPEANDP